MSGKIFLIAAFCFASAFASEIFIQSPKITDYGDWGEYEECPPGMYVYGFQLVSEGDQGAFGDDSALSGIYLLCIPFKVKRDSPDFLSWFMYSRAFAMISSSVGHAGYSRGVFDCPPPHFATGFELRTDYIHGLLYDDTAANNFRLTCSNGQVLEGDAESWGEWTGAQTCPRGYLICGMQTQVEKPGAVDETTLNNIKLRCCMKP
ncbi:unnamed protein product [Allacma fusca]|uniref:Vitelline membrane outer layer protein 1 homolog n=1 Tax=Allacma fusca TaxID=39272 RepID=A0A8J2P1M4_9HEXA|nr:unnamed protein product [Allacma fusca]